MLHGLRGQARTWDGLARELADSYHVIALDQRGRGDSDWSPDAEYNTAAYVSDLAGVVREAGIESFVLVGLSMGGANALAYATAYPERVRALVIEDSGPRNAESPAPGTLRIGRELDATPVEFASWEEARAFCAAERPGIAAEALQNRLDNTLKQLPDGRVTWKYDLAGIAAARRSASPVDTWPQVRSLRCPTLVLHGAVSDILLPAIAAAMAAANANIRVVDVPGAGHFVHDDNPAFFNREVRSFLASLP